MELTAKQKLRLKQLHWQKLQNVEGTVWASGLDGDSIDFDALEALFKLDDPDAVKKLAQAAKKSTKVLNPHLSQAFGFVLCSQQPRTCAP
jgi:hypothetical protein